MMIVNAKAYKMVYYITIRLIGLCSWWEQTIHYVLGVTCVGLGWNLNQTHNERPPLLWAMPPPQRRNKVSPIHIQHGSFPINL